MKMMWDRDMILHVPPLLVGETCFFGQPTLASYPNWHAVIETHPTSAKT